VTMISLPTGSVRSIFLRLWVRAPRRYFGLQRPRKWGYLTCSVLRPCAANLMET
jgi:hypothetical protein